MRDFDSLEDHPVLARMIEIICSKTQNENKNFFRVQCAYFIAKMAATMRAQINTKDRGVIPVNLYTLCLASSGFGKGHSTNIIEEQMMGGFKKRFIESTLISLAENNLMRLANEHAAYKGTDQTKEKDRLDKEYSAAGPYPFTFDSGTVPAVKQLRQKLLLSGTGAINLQIDEIGSNLLGNSEILTTFLELFDKGRTKAKLTKNTADNSRGVDIDGDTPANMLLFGTPTKLLDGGNIEDMFFEFLQTGYGRRFLFAWGNHERSANVRSAAEIYASLTDPGMNKDVQILDKHFSKLADFQKHGWSMEVPDEVAIELIEYRGLCERTADALSEHEDLRKTELQHRYFKALKLAGAFAFLDESPVVTMDNIYQAIKVVEISGKDFETLLTREKTYVKLARYIAGYNGDLTHADLTEALPYYKTGNAARQEIMTLAMAWGYKNGIVITRSFTEGIEFFSGSQLEETDLQKIVFSYSNQFAEGYAPEVQPFEKLHMLTNAEGYHWCNHRFNGNYRRGDNVIEGFNMVVFDIDGTARRDTVHEMLRDFTFMTHTTKRHGEDNLDRFRLIIPISYSLFLSKDDYQIFINNIMEWLPFESDEGANQRERKWLTNPKGEHHYNMAGKILDPIRFIPKTSRNEVHRNTMSELKNMGNFERWFAERMQMGNRNNQMIRFALALFDNGMNYGEIQSRVLHFNEQIDTPLSTQELQETVLKTVARRITERENG